MIRFAVILAAAMLSSCGDAGETSEVDPVSAPAGAGGIPDGTYGCSYSSGGMLMSLGEVVIDGERYGGFSGGRRGAYSVAADGAVEFSDGFAGVPEGFEVSGAQWDASEPVLWISIDSPNGNRLDVSCTPEG